MYVEKLIGCARVGTADHDVQPQLDVLQGAGCTDASIFTVNPGHRDIESLGSRIYPDLVARIRSQVQPRTDFTDWWGQSGCRVPDSVLQMVRECPQGTVCSFQQVLTLPV